MELDEWLEIDAYERMETGEGPIAVDRHIPPPERFAIRLWGTEWSVGQLTLHLEDVRSEPEPGVEKFVAHPLDLAFHPRRGVVNTRVLQLGDALSRPEIREYVAGSARRLRMTTGVVRDAVRQELDETPGGDVWLDRALPIEPVYLLRGACAELEPRELGIEPTRVIRCSWEEVPAHLDEKMPERAVALRDDGPNPVEAVNEQVRSLTRNYTDHETYIDRWEFATDQLLDGAEDRAA